MFVQVMLSKRFYLKGLNFLIWVTPFIFTDLFGQSIHLPTCFYLESDNFSIVGASPEVHVRLQDDDVLIRPIAGTRPRGKSAKEDQFLEQELLADEKEKAEHLMLVDLARNDIGRVCKIGSVQAAEVYDY